MNGQYKMNINDGWFDGGLNCICESLFVIYRGGGDYHYLFATRTEQQIKCCDQLPKTRVRLGACKTGLGPQYFYITDRFNGVLLWS